ncbi:MAG: DUF2062 domain-containing protein [Bacteroidota bacterium]|nr:DUF2062 domain-containing protein [Bacteroidota bacterium]
MSVEQRCKELIVKNKVVVLIPTYNNEKTLERVLKGVLQYTDSVVVVNDGSTDNTRFILSKYPQLQQLHIAFNSGKGMALRKGFEWARSQGFNYVITIDSDGQHYPDDLIFFLEAVEQEPTSVVLVGNRNMSQEGVPKKSSFGNKFSNFWFWFLTQIKLQDTQSGYRMYPLDKMPRKFYTSKFEFEIEILVRLAWKNVPIKNIPIKVLYDASERVSHFRPFKDFVRISILNTVLVCIYILYIIPKRFIERFQKKSIKRFVKEDLLGSGDTIEVKSLSIALGVFVGILPVWGFQSILAIFLAVLFRWNKLLAFTFSNISIPPMIPILVWLSLKIGAFFIPESQLYDFDKSIDLSIIRNHLYQYLIGSVTLAIIASLFIGILSYLLFLLFGKK